MRKWIANFIGKNDYAADKSIMTDMCDSLICESVYSGFIMNWSDQNLCRKIILHLAPIQMGAVDPKVHLNNVLQNDTSIATTLF